MTHDLQRHCAEFARAIRNRRFEITDSGLMFPDQKASIAGVFDTEHRRGRRLLSRDVSPNILPTQGLNHVLDVVTKGSASVSPWYVALFSGNVTPGATLTGQTFAAVCTEFTGYDESTRVAYAEGTSTGGVIDNAASRAIFTCNASATVYGGALLSASAKSAAGASDVCLAAARFSTSRAVVSGDELAVKYTLTLTSS